MTNDQMREAFDRIITNNPMVPSKADPEYDQWLFRKAWQAGYAAGMERAAGICAVEWDGAPDTVDYTNARNACADAIRAEIPKEGV